MGVSLGRRSLMGGVILVIPMTLTMALSAANMEPSTSGYSSPKYSYRTCKHIFSQYVRLMKFFYEFLPHPDGPSVFPLGKSSSRLLSSKSNLPPAGALWLTCCWGAKEWCRKSEANTASLACPVGSQLCQNHSTWPEQKQISTHIQARQAYVFLQLFVYLQHLPTSVPGMRTALRQSTILPVLNQHQQLPSSRWSFRWFPPPSYGTAHFHLLNRRRLLRSFRQRQPEIFKHGHRRRFLTRSHLLCLQSRKVEHC